MISFKIVRHTKTGDEVKWSNQLEVQFATDMLWSLVNVFHAHVKEVSPEKIVIYTVESFGQHRAQWTIETDTIFEGTAADIAQVASRLRENQKPVKARAA